MREIWASWHDYKYFPYERELAMREAQELLDAATVEADASGLTAKQVRSPERRDDLVYFSSTKIVGEESSERPTRQAALESTTETKRNRQETRYSAHGLHDYKGKFNPQTPQALLNIMGVGPGQVVLDPYTGSGTTLLEAAHRGAFGIGFDVNPLAVFVAQTKVDSLRVPAKVLRQALLEIVDSVVPSDTPVTDLRTEYLQSWLLFRRGE
jgi:tRNA G10  N-methylase Trm11